jgi:hypothetical protein
MYPQKLDTDVFFSILAGVYKELMRVPAWVKK